MAPAFFDPQELVQVKYEMLSAHYVDGRSVVEVARWFGLSRQTLYHIDGAFAQAGMLGLLPKRGGFKDPTRSPLRWLPFCGAIKLRILSGVA